MTSQLLRLDRWCSALVLRMFWWCGGGRLWFSAVRKGAIDMETAAWRRKCVRVVGYSNGCAVGLRVLVAVDTARCRGRGRYGGLQLRRRGIWLADGREVLHVGCGIDARAVRRLTWLQRAQHCDERWLLLSSRGSLCCST
jgi:hypothetical protein